MYCFQTLEAVEVYCFGRLLYEMTTGRSLERLTCDVTPHGCSPELSEFASRCPYVTEAKNADIDLLLVLTCEEVACIIFSIHSPSMWTLIFKYYDHMWRFQEFL